MAARKTLAGGKTPYFVFPHGTLDPWFSRTYPVKSLEAVVLVCNEGPLLSNARRVLFTSQTEAAPRGVLAYRVRERVVRSAATTSAAHAAEQEAAFAIGNCPPRRPPLPAVSEPHPPQEGMRSPVEAFAAIAADHPGLDLVIAGPDQTGWKANSCAGREPASRIVSTGPACWRRHQMGRLSRLRGVRVAVPPGEFRHCRHGSAGCRKTCADQRQGPDLARSSAGGGGLVGPIRRRVLSACSRALCN